MKFLPLLLGSGLLLSGCVSHIVANRTLKRPSSSTVEKSMKQLNPVLGGMELDSECIYERIYLCGDPAVEISVRVLEPADYSVRITSGFELDDEGDYEWTFTWKSTKRTYSYEDMAAIIGEERLCEFMESEDAQLTEAELTLLSHASMKAPLHESEVENAPTLFLLHGYSCRREMLAPWAFLFARNGFRVVLVDLRGHGASEGRKIGWGTYEVKDLQQLLTALIEEGIIRRQSIGVIGNSYGASLALLWAASDSRISSTVAISPYDLPSEAIQRVLAITFESNKILKLLPDRVLAESTEIMERKLGISWDDLSGKQAASGISHPILYIGSSEDKMTPLDEIQVLQENSPEGSRVLQTEKLPHIMVPFALEGVKDEVLSWLEQHLKAA